MKKKYYILQNLMTKDVQFFSRRWLDCVIQIDGGSNPGEASLETYQIFMPNKYWPPNIKSDFLNTCANNYPPNF